MRACDPKSRDIVACGEKKKHWVWVTKIFLKVILLNGTFFAREKNNMLLLDISECSAWASTSSVLNIWQVGCSGTQCCEVLFSCKLCKLCAAVENVSHVPADISRAQNWKRRTNTDCVSLIHCVNYGMKGVLTMFSQIILESSVIKIVLFFKSTEDP